MDKRKIKHYWLNKKQKELEELESKGDTEKWASRHIISALKREIKKFTEEGFKL